MSTYALGGRAGWRVASATGLSVERALRAAGSGTYTSAAFDGENSGCRWDRLCFELHLPPGAAMTLSPSEISADDFRGARHAHIEGYLVFNHRLCEAVLNAARTAGCTISLDLSAFEVVNEWRDWMFTQFGHGIDVVFANEDEIRAMYPGRGADYRALAMELATHDVVAAVKMGRDEVHRNPPVHLSDAVDTNGAGDAWAAGFLYGYLKDLPLAKCGAIASVMGSETVRHLGPLIPDSAWEAVRRRALAGAIG